MRGSIRVLGFLAIFFIHGYCSAVPLVIGVPALGDGLAVDRSWNTICAYLRDIGKIDVTFTIQKDYQSLIKNLEDHFIDIALLDYYWYDQERERLSILTVVETANKKNYKSLIIVPKSSIYYGLEDLKGIPLTLTRAKESSSGYYVPLGLLAREGMKIDSPRSMVYVETFNSVLKGVAYGGLQAGSIPSYVFEDEANSKLTEMIRIISESLPLPVPILSVRQGSHDQRYLKLQRVLVEMSKQKKGQEALHDSRYTGFSNFLDFNAVENLRMYIRYFAETYGTSN
jgi:ABC-type phosphate/phosphonate transport system substrate-binding protein